MKKLLLLAFFALGCYQIASANYYILKPTGGVSNDWSWYNSSDYTVQLSNSSTTATVNNVLSDPIDLPFDFTFFGNTYSQIKISENGYITFDTSATTSNGTNIALPSATAPTNAIFAYWDDLVLKAYSTSYPSYVITSTIGTAPNRDFAIIWYLVSPKGTTVTSNFMQFELRLHEQGNFEVVCYGGQTATTTTATVGAQNADGTIGVMSTNSPNENDFAAGINSASAAVVYKFIEGSQLNRDVTISKLEFPSIFALSQSPIPATSFQIMNYGLTYADSVLVNYQIDAGTTTSHEYQTNIATGELASLNLDIDISALAVNTNHTLKVWTTLVNGLADQNTTNDSAKIFNFYINNGATTSKKAILEEFSGAWCGFCPRGHLTLRDLSASTPDLLSGVHHGSDSMMTSVGSQLSTKFNDYGGVPAGMVDRYLSAGETTIAFSDGDFASHVESALNRIAPVKVTVENTFDPATRKIHSTITAKFVDYLKGKFQFNAFVIEDSVRGTSGTAYSTQTYANYPAYDQHNYFSAAGNGYSTDFTELTDAPAVIPGYFHNHVISAIPSGINGVSSIIPDSVKPDDTYTWSFDYVLPAQTSVSYSGTGENNGLYSTVAGSGRYKIKDTKILAFITLYDSDIYTGAVLNAEEAGFDLTSVNENSAENNSAISVYPNPAKGFCSVKFNLANQANLTVKLVDALGSEIRTLKSGLFIEGEQNVNFYADDLASGVYFINISGEGVNMVKAVSVIK